MTRADVYLVEHGHAASRAEAQAAIKAGLVRVDGMVIDKPARDIPPGAAIVYEKSHPYVSRGGVKLAAALDAFGLSPEGLICVDLGASTGGFTQVLLERGARKVFAIDVGHGQLHPSIAADPRVIASEGVNVRDLDAGLLPEPFQAVVADISFISLRLALPSALALAAPGAWIVALVKPQFEVGRENVGKGGIVRDEALQAAAVDKIAHWLSGLAGWNVVGTMPSPIMGGDGNIEYLIAARKT